MMVYVLMSGPYYGEYDLTGVFSTKEKAQDFLDRSGRPGEIEAWVVDERNHDVKRKDYRCEIELKTGRIVGEWTSGFYMVPPDHPGEQECVTDRPHVRGVSYNSPEHARQMALNAYQQWHKEHSGER